MGEHELQNALRREADARIRALWSEAEEEVAARREALATNLDALRRTLAREADGEARAVRRAVTAATGREGHRCRLLAEADLSERLLTLAARLLAELAAAHRETIWRDTVSELPNADWQTLTVHPDDRSRAHQDFPLATVQGDVSVIGGVVAATAGDRIIVDNSLAGRLARGWQELLPELIAVLERETAEHGTPGPATAG